MEDTGAEFYTAVDRDGEQRQCLVTSVDSLPRQGDHPEEVPG